MKIIVVMDLPTLGQDLNVVQEKAKEAGVDFSHLSETKFEISNTIKLGYNEVQVMEIFMKGIKKMFEAEKDYIAKLKEDARLAAIIAVPPPPSQP